MRSPTKVTARAVPLVCVAALALSGLAALTLSPSASAVVQHVPGMYYELNATGFGPASAGPQDLSMTVTPSVATPGEPIRVDVSSTTLNFPNGPAALAPNTYEIDAVVSVGGVDYVLRGARNATTIPAGTTTAFAASWTVSSRPGSSHDGNGDSGGIGATVRGAEGVPVTLTAPGTPGAYTLGLKALALNGANAGLEDDYDAIFSADGVNWTPGCGTYGTGCGAAVGPGGTNGSFAANLTPTHVGTAIELGNIVFDTPVTLAVSGAPWQASATLDVASVTGQAAGVTNAARAGDVVQVSGDHWTGSVGSSALFAQVCASNGSCTAYVNGSLVTNGSGSLSGGVTVPAAASAGPSILHVTDGVNDAYVPIHVIGAPSITLSPSSAAASTSIDVSVSGFNPGVPVHIQGQVAGASSGDSDVTLTTGVAGGGSTSYTVVNTATDGISASQWTGSSTSGAPARSTSTGFTITASGTVAPPPPAGGPAHLFAGPGGNGSLARSITPVDAGVGHINVTVTPSTAVPGQDVEIEIGSPDLALPNASPFAIAAGDVEIDAVVSLDGTDYVLRGNTSTVAVAASPNAYDFEVASPLFEPGWSVSSTPNHSTATNTGLPASATSIGAVPRLTPTVPVQVKAPSTTGAYPVVVKAIVLNRLAAPSTAGPADPLDATYSLASTAPNGPGPALDADLPSAYVGSTSFTVSGTPAIAPGAPTNATATTGTQGVGRALVHWNAASSNGGQPITGYQVVSDPPSSTCTVSAVTSLCFFSGLTAGQAYTFEVRARNGDGLLGPAATTNQVMPVAVRPDAGSTASGSTTVTTPTLSATASGGTGSVSVATYPSDPSAGLSTTPGTGTPSYVDIAVSPNSSFTSLDVVLCNGTPGDPVKWWDGLDHAWKFVSPAPTTATGACNGNDGIKLSLSSTSSPTLAQLYGTPFVVLTGAPTATIVSVAGQNPGVAAARLGNFNTTFTVSGTHWAPNLASSAISVQAFVAGPSSNTLHTDPNGDLSGTITVNFGALFTSNSPFEQRELQIDDGNGNSGILLYQALPTYPTITFSPSTAAPGSIVSVAGQGFSPGQDVTVASFKAVAPPNLVLGADSVTMPASPYGTVGMPSTTGSQLVLTDPATIGFVAYQGVMPPFTSQPSATSTRALLNWTYANGSPTAVPSAPRHVATTNLGAGDMLVTWDAPTTDSIEPATGYTAFEGSTQNPLCTSVGAATSCVAHNLAVGSAHFAAVSATNGSGTGPPGLSGALTVITAVAAVGWDSASTSNSSTPAVATSGFVKARASGGTGTVNVATYPSNPMNGVGSVPGGSTFFDLSLSTGHTFTSVEVTLCSGTPGAPLLWWDDTATSYLPVQPDPVATPNVCPGGSAGSVLTLDDQSTPWLGSLYGTPFVIPGPSSTSATASVTAVGGQSGTDVVRLGTLATSGTPNATVTLTGADWSPSLDASSITARYCDLSGASCDVPVTTTLATDGSGALTGDVDAGIGASTVTGVRSIRIEAGSDSVLVPITVLGAPSLSLSPTGGPGGTVVTISGSNFNPGQSVSVRGSTSATSPYAASSDAAVPTTADPSGAIAVTYTVNDPSTASITAAQGTVGGGSVSDTFAAASFSSSATGCAVVSPATSCSTEQTLYGTVTAGVISQAAALWPGNPSVTAVVFCVGSAPVSDPGGSPPGAVSGCRSTVSGSAVPMFATLNPVTVTDTRGGGLGWTLTAQVTSLTSGSYSIPASAVSATPSCAASLGGSAPGASGGAAGQHFGLSAVVLCQKDTQTNPGGSTSGQYLVSVPLRLDVPAFAGTGDYTGTITVTLA